MSPMRHAMRLAGVAESSCLIAGVAVSLATENLPIRLPPRSSPSLPPPPHNTVPPARDTRLPVGSS